MPTRTRMGGVPLGPVLAERVLVLLTAGRSSGRRRCRRCSLRRALFLVGRRNAQSWLDWRSSASDRCLSRRRRLAALEHRRPARADRRSPHHAWRAVRRRAGRRSRGGRRSFGLAAPAVWLGSGRCASIPLLPYFNELAGGPAGGAFHLDDSTSSGDRASTRSPTGSSSSGRRGRACRLRAARSRSVRDRGRRDAPARRRSGPNPA